MPFFEVQASRARLAAAADCHFMASSGCSMKMPCENREVCKRGSQTRRDWNPVNIQGQGKRSEKILGRREMLAGADLNHHP